jgi:hypothetical protein
MLQNLLFFLFIITFVLSVSFGASLFICDFQYLHLLIFIVSTTSSLFLVYYSGLIKEDPDSIKKTSWKIGAVLLYCVIFIPIYQLLFKNYDIKLGFLATATASIFVYKLVKFLILKTGTIENVNKNT